MKTDTIFYELFQNFPQIFFELIEQPTATSEVYEFTSVEIKQIAFRIDGLFLPTEDTTNQPIYFVEVQFQKDQRIYHRFFGEIFLYLSRYQGSLDWRGVIIFKRRSLDPGTLPQYLELLTSQRVRRIYLDELGEAANQSIGVGVVKLVVESPKKAVNVAKQLLNKAREEITDTILRQQVIELIEKIVLYKFPRMSRQELEAMFGFNDLKQTKVYQEGRQEGRQEVQLQAIPTLLAMGLNVEQIARALDLTVEEVRRVASEQQSD